MKRIISVFLAILVLSSLTMAFAEETDITAITDEQLAELYENVKAEMLSRGLLVEPLELEAGKYIVGQDIGAGTYIFTCTEADGKGLEETYSALGDVYNSISKEFSLSGAIGSLVDAFGSLSKMTVEVIGDYGTVIQSVELGEDESVELTLTENTAIQLVGGKCSVENKV